MWVVIQHGVGVLRSVVASAGVDILEIAVALGLVEKLVASGVDVLEIAVALGLMEVVVASGVVVLQHYIVVADLRFAEDGLSDVAESPLHVAVVLYHVVEVLCRSGEVLSHEVDVHLLLILLVASDDSVVQVDMVEQQEHVGCFEVRHGVQGEHCGNAVIPLLDVYLQGDGFWIDHGVY